MSAHNHHHHDFASANRDYFDQHSHSYDRASGLALAKRVGKAVLKAYAFDDETTTVMDFACGTGLLSRELAPECKRIVGVDISEGMVAQFNARVDKQGIPREEMEAVCTTLKGEAGELAGEKFDVIVCSMGYHHLVAPEDTNKILAGFLRPGGCLMIVDVKTREGASLDRHREIVVHTEGFTEARMRAMFVGAELSFGFETVSSAKMDGVEVDIFLANGTVQN